MHADLELAGRSAEPHAVLPQEEAFIPAEDGGTIHCVSMGQGPTLLLAHGYLLDLTLWRGLAARLARAGHRVVMFDQRGHADSREGTRAGEVAAAADDYATLLRHFGVERATLVGHSMGGFLALHFCLRHPELARQLRRLVLVGANAGSVAKGSLQNKLQIPLLRLGLLPKLWRIPSVGRALMKPLFGDTPDPSWLELTRTMLIRQDVARPMRLLHAMCYDDLYPRLSEIATETRVLCGERDGTCPPWHSRQLAELLPNARGSWLPGMGHMLPFEAADSVCGAILE
ncbi:MAG TPA: alpha/beta hydrolase [Polyangiales bacterium]